MCSVCVLVVFKLCDQRGISSRKVIVVSYLVSALAGFIVFASELNSSYSRWLIPAALEGIAFYVVFRLISKSAQSSGISVTSVASKMSVLIPIFIGIFILDELVNSLIMIGILVGLVAVYLTVGSDIETKGWIWPFLVFIGSGCIDSSFKLIQVWGLAEAEFPMFVTTIFTFAFLFSFVHLLLTKDRKINFSHVSSGLVLGLSNLGTVYFLLLALAIPSLDSVFVYSLTNFGVVVVATLVAVLVFRESINTKAQAGLSLAAMSILILHFAYR